MKSGIIIIGDEILIGQVLDTNSSWIALEMNKIGIKNDIVITIGDEKNQILEAIDKCFEKVDVVFMTGGLGPTKDDITKKVICEKFNTELVLNESVLENVRRLLLPRGIEMTENNRSQALVPASAKVINNDVGTAPAMMINENGKLLFSMPGVPFEMHYIMENKIIPYLKSNTALRPIFHKTLLLTCIAESILAEKISRWEDSLPENVRLAYLPAYSSIRLRLSVYDPTDKTEDFIAKKVRELEQIVPENIIAEEDITLEKLLGKMLLDNSKTVATAESCTGGRIASLITSVAGCSEYYKGSVVSYCNEVKADVLSVDKSDLTKFGAVSSQVVEQMAIGVKQLMKTDYAVSTSGVAGPTGGSAEKPVGTVWIAVATPQKVVSKKFFFSTVRSINIERFSAAALSMLIVEIKKETKPSLC